MIEMQPEQETAHVVITNVSNMFAPQSLSLDNDPKIQRIRKILSITIGILFAFFIVGMISAIFGHGIGNGIKETSHGAQVGQSLILVFFYTFGLFVTYRYSATGLRVFAWLDIISVSMLITGILSVLFLDFSPSTTKKLAYDRDRKDFINDQSSSIYIVIPGAIAVGALDIVIIKYAFQLAKLIDIKKSLAIRQAHRILYSIT
ncbi:unnamed protein product [Rotaria sordida]|uniref:Uncharacterized protein n=1 Tax=Rotaria sordida TaxID=392033 RepID=A0A814J5W1_9BILA|nr:unnamed protein product [Rotaria sordida]CAF1033789.1 unnamed protein product [Rotaria sordida]CAF1170249.1 unnamed protein product [Rotaria sordida]CAF3802158.1 unnamed protein product [Rotaria sordida]